MVDQQGIAWHAGNRNGRIGRIDPASGEIKTFMTGEARDPHTMVFDDKGHIWFTSQGSNRIGRLHMASGKVDLVTPNDQPSTRTASCSTTRARPGGVLLRTNLVVKVDPSTLEVKRFEQGDEKAR